MTPPHNRPAYPPASFHLVLKILSAPVPRRRPVGSLGLILFFIFFLPFILCPPCTAGGSGLEKSNHTAHILILNSYHQGFRWTDDIVAAVKTAMSARLSRIEFHVEYMDSKRYQDKHLDELLSRSLALKYQGLQPDIIITSDDDALDFMKHYHQQLFPDVPVVFCGVNNVKDALSVDRDHFTGLVETLDISANIDLARRLLPKINEIVIVSDGTPTGIGTRQMAKNAEPEYPDLHFIYLNGEELSTDEMLAKLHSLKTTSAVIAPAWYLDKNGATFDNKEIYPLLAKASSVPVFGTSSANLGLGIIGGKLNSGTIQGEYSANQALRILAGKATTRNLPVETASQNRYMFDYRQLIRFAIDKRSLPPGSIILNRPVPFYERYKTETALAATAFLLLVIIIAFLLWNIWRRQKVERDLVMQKLMVEQSEERFRTLHNASFGGIFIHDQGTIVDCNQGLSKISGYTFDELIGMDGLNLIAPDWRTLIMQNILSDLEEPCDVEGIRKDGATYPLYLQGKNLPYKGRTIRVVEFRDISERKKAEQEKISLEAQLHQARKMESVGQLAGGVAHDFNNMLSAILGHAELAMRRCSPSESVLSHLKGIEEASLRSADLVKQLLAFARKQTIAPIVLDVNDMSAAILKILRRVIGEDIDLSWLPGSDLWKVKMDPSQIDQLLVNLSVNARDAITGVGKIVIETKNVTFDLDYCEVNRDFIPGEYVMLAVSDNGCGMSKDMQENIFEPFFTTKEMGKGTGLGLATVYGIVKQNQGFINLYSEPDKGTTFRIYLPRFIGKDMALPPEITVGAPKGRGEAVLLVEDEAAIREVAQRMLKELGYVVFIAGTPGEAIKLMETHTAEIQLLITDVVMPEMNGRELAELIRDIKPEVKCLFTSGYTANVIAHHGVLDEDVYFLAKPFSMNDLAVKVHQAMNSSIIKMDHLEREEGA